MNRLEQDKLDDLFRREADAVDDAYVENLQRTITRDLKPVRRMARPAAFTAAFLLIAAAVSGLSLLIMPSYGWDSLTLTARIAVFATIISSASLLAFSLSLQMVPGSRIYWTPGLLVAGISVLIVTVLAAVFQIRAQPEFVRRGLVCMRAGVPFAVPASLLFAVLLRRGLVLSPRRAGMITGMLAGLVSMAVLEVHCPNFDLAHIIIWHFGIPLTGAFTGYLFGVIGERIGHSFKS